MHTVLTNGARRGAIRDARSRRWWRRLGLALLMLLPLGGANLLTAASFSSQSLAVTDPTDSLRPQVAADSANNLHIVWHEGEGTNQDQAVKYAKGTLTGAGYSWSGPIDVYRPQPRSGSTYIYPRIAIDRTDQVHVIFTFGGKVLYKRWPAADGPASGTQPLELGTGIYPSIAVGANNRPQVVWEQEFDGNFEIVFREFDGTQFTPAVNLSNNDDNSLNPDLAVDSAGNSHVVWYDKTPGIRIQYARRVGGSWQPVQTISGPESYFPSIAAGTDGCVFMAWNQVSTASAIFRKQCGDQIVEERSAGPTYGSPRGAIGASSTGKAVVAWDSKEPGVDNIYYSIVGDGNVTPQQRLAPGGRQFWPDVAGMPNGQIAVVWQEDNGGRFDPAYAVLTVGPPPPSLTGSLTINGGATITRTPNVTVQISNTSPAAADKYGLADGVEPGTPNLGFSNPQATVAFTLDVADGKCRVHTLFGKLGSGSTASPAFFGTITYDPSARAWVQARNPDGFHNRDLNSFVKPLVPGGDVAYTGRREFNMEIAPDLEECTGLKRFAIKRHGAALAESDWQLVPAEGSVSNFTEFVPDLPDNGGQGTYEFDVYVEDQAGNTTANPYVARIVYDTTAPTVDGASGELAASSDLPRGGVASVTVPALTVNDNLYVDSASGARYWGYWVAVKPAGQGAPSEAEWERYGAVVPGYIHSPLQWPVAQGLVGGWESFAPGSYALYIRFIDGAGNGSAPLRSQSFQVNQLEFMIPLPLVHN